MPNKLNLKELLKKWQAILRLQDWNIKIRWVKHYDLANDTKGQCRWVLGKKAALISILEPEDFDPSIKWEQDPECTVVHELLHLHIAPLDDGDEWRGLKDKMMEQAICSISEALVNCDRAPAIVKISSVYVENPMGPKEKARKRK